MLEIGDSEGELEDLFREPKDFYKPEKPSTLAHHKLVSGKDIELRLVGQDPLWGHMLWNAGRATADYIDRTPELVKDKFVLEFGSGSGLPSIVAAIKGASHVVVTDYPDSALISNIQHNVEKYRLDSSSSNISVQGFLWGSSVNELKAHLPEEDRAKGFHVLILADLIFNHSEHAKLIKSIQDTLRRGSGSYALVFFTPHRPWLLEKDMDFFRLAEANGLAVEKLLEKVMNKAMFEVDRGVSLLLNYPIGGRLMLKSGRIIAPNRLRV